MLGAYFVGYLLTQVPGGRLAEIYGGKRVFFVAVALNVAGTLISPLAANVAHEVLVAVRVVEGLGAGVTFPAMNVLIARWAPGSERSGIASIVYGGKTRVNHVVLFTFSPFPQARPWAR